MVTDSWVYTAVPDGRGIGSTTGELASRNVLVIPDGGLANVAFPEVVAEL